ncbi:MAG: hypothetical protein KU29_06415 [Sulfurovum sp. FS06-10]|jgi:chemotaxis protein MotB|nr:MAG: hypothetical protein KU29_06415 [Sulfurovum sp. FS06-10]
MFKKNNTNNESTNFWISYADLMAGLLFVFILLIGAIIVKSTILKNDLIQKESALNEQTRTLVQQSDNLKGLSKTLQMKDDEINKLNQLLLAQNTKIDDYSEQIIVLQNLTEEQNNSLNQHNIELDNYKNNVVLLSNSLTQQDEKLKLNEEKLLQLLQALDNKQTKYDDLLTKLQAQKAKIKSLTGIKLQIITELKSSLGNKINIDKESGSLRLASNVLFDKGSSELKESAKSELKANFIEYVNTLITNKTIAEHLDSIIIEGHTDSDGSYLYNLNLSQQRAYAVMNYLLTLDYIKQHNIQDKLVASGRSYQDAIKINGLEDKDASRRIEVKFRLKNEDAMYEIERILDAN